METTNNINQPRKKQKRYPPRFIDYSQCGDMSREEYKRKVLRERHRSENEARRLDNERRRREYEETEMQHIKSVYERNTPALEKLYDKFCNKTYNALCANAKPGFWRVLSIILHLLLVIGVPLAILFGITFFVFKYALGLLVFCIFALAVPAWFAQALSGK